MQVVKALVISLTSFAGRDATLNKQKEETANTKENELYEVTTSCDPHIEMEENTSYKVTTSCDPQNRGINIEMEENTLYETPTSMIKMSERDAQKKKRSIEMKEDVVYEVPPQ